MNEPPPPYTEQPTMPPLPQDQPPSYPAAAYPPAPPYPGPPAAPVTVEPALPQFGPFPQSCVCPYCHSSVTSDIIYESGVLTWLSCSLIFIFGGVLFCCLIPFCCSPCQDVRHFCPHCNRTLGLYKRL